MRLHDRRGRCELVREGKEAGVEKKKTGLDPDTAFFSVPKARGHVELLCCRTASTSDNINDYCIPERYIQGQRQRETASQPVQWRALQMELLRVRRSFRSRRPVVLDSGR